MGWVLRPSRSGFRVSRRHHIPRDIMRSGPPRARTPHHAALRHLVPVRPPRQFTHVTRRIPIVFAGMMFDSLVPRWRTTVLTLAEVGAPGVLPLGHCGHGDWRAGDVVRARGARGRGVWHARPIFRAGYSSRPGDCRAASKKPSASGRRSSPARPCSSNGCSSPRSAPRSSAATSSPVVVALLGPSTVTRHATIDDLNTFVAIAVIGVFWFRTRAGHSLTTRFARWLWTPLLLLAAIAVWSLVAVFRQHIGMPPFIVPALDLGTKARLRWLESCRARPATLAGLVAFGYVAAGHGRRLRAHAPRERTAAASRARPAPHRSTERRRSTRCSCSSRR